MQIAFWNRLSWWQRTRAAMIFTVAGAVTLAILLTIFVATLAHSAALTSIAWLAFTALPLIVVALVASLARVQQQINIRSPQTSDLQPTFPKGPRK